MQRKRNNPGQMASVYTGWFIAYIIIPANDWVAFHPLDKTNNQGPLVTAQRWTDECCPGKEVACHYLFGGMADPLKLYIIPYTFF